jgi:Holliday junction resolvase
MNSKRKGAEGEREWAAFCRNQGYECRRTAQYCGNTGDASDVVGLPGVHIEVKRVERLNIEDAMSQAIRDSSKSGRLPIVAHRKNHCEWLVTMRAEDWFQIYREYEAGRVEVL